MRRVRVAESPPNGPLFNRAAKKKPQGSEDSALRYRGCSLIGWIG